MLKAPTKITFKHSTKMTLNARFTSIMKSRPPTTTQTVTPQVSSKNLASEKNRRLAQQMENRTAVGAALGTSKPSTSAAPRLSVHDRLGTNSARGRGRSLPSSAQARLQNNASFRGLSTQARGLLRGALRRGGNQKRGISSRGRGFQSSRSSQRGRRGAGRGSKGFSTTIGKSFRGGVYKRGYRGRGRGRGGRGRGGASRGKTPANKGVLDQDLDSYMSKTRGSMDAELDAYMSNVGGD